MTHPSDPLFISWLMEMQPQWSVKWYSCTSAKKENSKIEEGGKKVLFVGTRLVGIKDRWRRIQSLQEKNCENNWCQEAFDKTLKNFILIFIACSEIDQYLGHDEVMKEEIDANKFIISASVLSILILVYFPQINYPIAYLSTSAIFFFFLVMWFSCHLL